MMPAAKNLEARELLTQLEVLSNGSGRTEKDRLSAYRLLHSLKSWAALRHLGEIETHCHRLELSIRGEGPLTQVAVDEIRKTLAVLHHGLDNPTIQRSVLPAIPLNDRIRILLPGALQLDLKTISLLRELRSQGRDILMAWIWISPDEAMPITRILLLQSILEDQSLVYAEAWLWGDAGPVGPQDTRNLALDVLTGNGAPLSDQASGQGALYRCLFAPLDRRVDPLERLWIDQVEAIHCSVFTPGSENAAGLVSGSIGKPKLAPQDNSLQGMLLQQRRFMPGPRGLSVNTYLSFENSWKTHIALIQEIQGIDTGEYFRRLFLQAGELPLALDATMGMVPTQWRLLVEPIRCHESILRVVGDLLVQLIRNSLAHGRQSVSTRQALHKPAAMQIRLAIVVEGENLKLEYSDDGNGIDPDLVLQKAGRSPGEPVKDADLLEIISKAEFSTREQAVNNAGQGMGLSLVDHSVRQILRGKLELQNRVNKGAIFTIRFPRRLFPVSVMIFQGITEIIAIPTVNFGGSLVLHAGSVDHEADAQWFLRFAGRSLGISGTESIANPSGLVGMTGILLVRDGEINEVLVVQNLIGDETVFMEVSSASIYSRTLQAWVALYTSET